MSARDAERGLTAGAFESLLARLGPDAERAGAAYEDLRRALVSFFTWRGAATPDECADETLDRLGRRLEEGTVVDDVPRFARGIARLVLLEHWRRLEAQSVSFDDIAASALVAPEPSDDTLSACLERCLKELPAATRDLLLQYYAAEGRDRVQSRKRITRALAISESALRNRAQRARDALERCMLQCLAAATGTAPHGADMQ
jgi:DNA-directed RNA polymerase specialized sigma24 family protein